MKKPLPVSGSPAKVRPAKAKSSRLGAAFAELSKLTKAVDAGASAVAALITYHTLVPEQLPFLRGSAFFIMALGVVATWMGWRHVRRNGPKIVLAAVLGLLILLVLNIWVVEEVQYGMRTDRVETSRFLVGTGLTEFGHNVAQRVGSTSASDIIRAAGRDQIPTLWRNYYAVAIAYMLTFMLFTFFSAMAIGVVVERLTSRRR